MFRRPFAGVLSATWIAVSLMSGCDNSSTGTAPVAHEGTGPQAKAPAAGPSSPLAKKEAAKK